jgi:hypothetical protein
LSTNLQVTFSGPSNAVNALRPVGSYGNYFGSAPDFTAVGAELDNGTYKLTIMNYGGVTGWRSIFTMTKDDNAPGNIIGLYAEDGGTGTATVSP